MTRTPVASALEAQAVGREDEERGVRLDEQRVCRGRTARSRPGRESPGTRARLRMAMASPRVAAMANPARVTCRVTARPSNKWGRIDRAKPWSQIMHPLPS